MIFVGSVNLYVRTALKFLSLYPVSGILREFVSIGYLFCFEYESHFPVSLNVF